MDTKRRGSGRPTCGSGYHALCAAEALERRALLSASFGPPVAFQNQNGPTSVLVSDFNGDGRQDVAVANKNDSSLAVLLGNGAGQFGIGSTTKTGFAPMSIAVGDFDGDGRRDLASGTSENQNNMLLGNGRGGFAAAPGVAMGVSPHSVAVGDFNGDGRQDLAVADKSSNNVSVLLGDGTGRFNAAPAVKVGSLPSCVVVGDFDGNARQDLAVAYSGTNAVTLMFGDGAGGFAVRIVRTNVSAQSMAVGDFNADSYQDLAVANQDDDSISVILGGPPGAILFLPAVTVGGRPASLAVGEFDGDGHQDLVVANSESNTLSVLINNGFGNFAAGATVPAGRGPVSVAVGDFNGDGRQDLAAGNIDSDTVTVSLNTGSYLVVAVSLTAPDPSAAEQGRDPGAFRLSRTSATSVSPALTVNLSLAGTATSGADSNNFASGSPFAGRFAIIPAGASFVDLPVTPVDDALVEGRESYLLSLRASSNGSYSISTVSHTATVTITDNDGGPILTSSVVGDGTAQRSQVRQVTMTFDRAVTLAGGAVTLQRLNTGGSGTNDNSTPTDASGALSGPSTLDNKTFVFTLLAGNAFVQNGSLADGIYRLTVDPAKVTAGGVAMAAAPQPFTFHRLFGDRNGDGTVNPFDYLGFRNAFGKTQGLDPGYVDYFDFNNDGTINPADYLPFRNRFGKTFTYPPV